MVSHVRFIIGMVCFIVGTLAYPPLAVAKVQPGITLIGSDETIYLGDSITLEVEAVGITEALDISTLFKDADLIRETTGTRIAVINERVVEVKLRRMEFLPRREGRVIFGPLSGMTIKGPVLSNSVIIDVQAPADTNWQPDPDDLTISQTLTVDNGASDSATINIIDTSASSPQPFVGQHMVFDIQLRHRHPIADEQLMLPDFDGFDVLEQFIQRRTVEELDNGERWRVIAWRYHLFAQRSGAIDIDGVRWKGTAIRSRTQRSDFDRHTDTFTLFAKPAASQASWWLPARRVALTDEWSKDPRTLSAGDEIIRTITLNAHNVLASHLPSVTPLESRALTTTPISHHRSQQLVGDQISASAVFKFRMVAQSPIPVFLDTVRVPWYSIVEDRKKDAIIPARRINVGLPDRADLLADIALNDSWKDKLLLRLRSSGESLVPWHVTLGLLLMLALFLSLRELAYWLDERRKRRSGQLSGVLPEL